MGLLARLRYTAKMKVYKKPDLARNEFSTIYGIWNSVYPSQAAFSNESGFEEYLGKAGNPTHYCAFFDNALVGWLMTFDREDKRWFTVLVTPESQGLGVGRELLKKVKKDELEINGWILEEDHYVTSSGNSYKSPRAFYLKNGFEITRESSESRGMNFTKIYWAAERV